MMRVRTQICVAIVVAFAVLIVFGSSAIAGPPSPHHRHGRSSPSTMSVPAALLAFSILPFTASFSILAFAKAAIGGSERLTLICVRLC